MFEIQFNSALRGNRGEETRLVETRLGKSSDEVTNIQIAVAKLCFKFNATLIIHDMSVTEDLSIGSCDYFVERAVIIWAVALCSDSVRTILVAARPHADAHLVAGLLQKFTNRERGFWLSLPLSLKTDRRLPLAFSAESV